MVNQFNICALILFITHSEYSRERTEREKRECACVNEKNERDPAYTTNEFNRDGVALRLKPEQRTLCGVSQELRIKIL